jgi:hypothetical protein
VNPTFDEDDERETVTPSADSFHPAEAYPAWLYRLMTRPEADTELDHRAAGTAGRTTRNQKKKEKKKNRKKGKSEEGK